MDPKPSIGRIVHYQAFGTPGGEYKSQPRAAMITDVDQVMVDPYDGGTTRTRVALCILNPTGMFFNTDVPYSETPRPGHWNWPPRV